MIAKRNEILSRLKKVENEVSTLNEEEVLFQKEIKREFGYDYSPKTWLVLYPSLLKPYLMFGDGTLPENRFYADISKIEMYLDLQIKKNQEKLSPSQPQLVKKVEI
jgi:ribosome-associated translation inhibitor RaiA